MEKHSWSFDRHLQRILWGRTVRLQFLKGFVYNPRTTLPPMIVPIPTERATRLLIDWSNGNREAAAALMPLVYEELRRLARGYLQRERPAHTLQGTGLVHEAYLRLVDQQTTTWRNRAHFFGVAAQLMRRVLVDYARRHRTGKRGGEWNKVEFDETLAPSMSRNLDVIGSTMPCMTSGRSGSHLNI